MSALVSVIIPTYKREVEMVDRAVQSVLTQTYESLEIILVDDSPSDFEGRVAIENYVSQLDDDRVRLVQHEVNKGANVARNTGIKMAEGEFVAFLDDDDEWLPLKLEEQIKKFNDPMTGLVYSPYYVVKNDKAYKRKTPLEKGDIFDVLLRSDNFIGSTSCVMIRKSCIDDVGMFDEQLPSAQDYELYLRLSRKYKVNVTEEPLMLYYEHEGERISGNPQKKLEARKYIYEKYKDEISRHPKINSDKHLMIAYGYHYAGDVRSKWKHWFTALKIYPAPSKRLFKSAVKFLFDFKGLR